LDYLAVSFIDQQWSVKALIREIVLSKTYQRSSTYQPHNFEVDPFNDALWRVTPKTLDAEAIRDGLLAIGGTLDTDRPERSQVADLGDGRFGRNFDETAFDQNNRNRSVYLPIVRDKVNEPLALFDFPDPNMTSSGRAGSIVPTQALYMMNSSFVAQQAARMAVEMSKQGKPAQQVEWAFLTTYGRQPTDDEIDSSVNYVKSISDPKNFLPVADSTNRFAQSRRRSQAGNQGQGMRGRGQREQIRAPQTAANLPKLNEAQRRLAIFCQALLGSAEYRILN
jgi:hypothetical protein